LIIALALAARSDSNWLIPKLNDRLLLARCDGFALGGLLALGLEDTGWLSRNRSKASSLLVAVIGLTLVYFVWGCWKFQSLTFIGLPTPMYPAETIFAFVVLYGGIIGLFALHSGSHWLAPFRLGPLVYLGRISYGLYLYHYVVYWVVDGCRVGPQHNDYNQPWQTQALKLGMSLVAAMVSWHLIEQPILRWKNRFDYRAESQERG
jgi:peptidoglycan/LPS O-acetylase OafA/YrhL